MKIGTLKVDFTKRYVLALMLIALLATGVFTTFHFALKMSESTALIINISGKQGMLSQRIALLLHYYSLESRGKNPSDALPTKELLVDAIEEMSDANERLSTGVLNETVTVKLTPKVYAYYFGEMDLNRRVSDYLALAHSCLNDQKHGVSKAKLSELTRMSEALLLDLNNIVVQYQKEGEESIAIIEDIELTAWIITIFVLLMEVIFIFQPMANRIRELFQKEQWNKNNLEQEIQIRTFSLEQANEKLNYTASHDPLTGLNNRLNLERELENLLDHYRLNHIPFAVLMLDIDWFKKVNDNYGHDVGDFVLQELSMLIRDSIRTEDSAYRAGGEEFVIIFNRISAPKAMEKADAIRRKVQEHPFIFGDHNFKVTISGGLYHPIWVEGTTIHGVMKLADNALYNAKHAGRNRIIAAETSLEESISHFESPVSEIKAQGIHADKILFADFDIMDLLGYSNEMLSSGEITFKDILHREDHDWFDKLALKKPFLTTLRMRHANGNMKIIKVQSTPLDDETWKIQMQDPILLAKSAEESMTLANFEAMMTNTDDFIYFKDRFHVFTAGSHTLVQLTNVRTEEDLIGKTDYEVFPSEFADQYFKLEKDVFSGELDVAREVQPILDKNGNKGWVDNRKYPIKNKEGEIIGLFGIARTLPDYHGSEVERL